MMKAVATKEAVYKAADEIAAEGREPGQIEVQQRTGGSYTTVQKHLAAWAQERAATAQVEVPADVSAVAERAVRDIYSAAVTAAKAALVPQVEQAQAAAATANERLATAEQEIARLETVVDGKDDELITMAEKLRSAETALATMDGRLQATTEQLSDLSDRLQAAEREVTKARALVLALEASQELSEAVAQIRARLDTDLSDDTLPSSAKARGTKAGKGDR
jgi:chromosome segregation ATPase